MDEMAKDVACTLTGSASNKPNIILELGDIWHHRIQIKTHRTTILIHIGQGKLQRVEQTEVIPIERR